MPANMKKTAELVISLHVKKQFQCVYTHLEYRTTLVVFALILSQNHTVNTHLEYRTTLVVFALILSQNQTVKHLKANTCGSSVMLY